MAKVALVTDSTACLAPSLVAEQGIVVVPLQVVVGTRAYADGVDPEASPARVAEALQEHRPVSTSRPSPAAVLDTYAELAAAGAEEIVSVHLSAEVSATYESVVLASRQSPVPVHALDTRQIGAATGYAVLAAARALAGGGTAEDAVRAARSMAERTVSLFYVDTLEYLRRGGRVGSATALVGSALAVKPLLQVVDGSIATVEKVRTSGRALSRLADLAVEAAGDSEVAVTVSHLANASAAATLAEGLAGRLADHLGGRGIEVSEVGAVIGAHVGPGLVGVVVAPID